MDLWGEIKKLEGKVLKTLDREKSFEVVVVLDSSVIVKPLSTRKDGGIPREQIEGAFQQLISSDQITQREIETQHSPRNPVYVATILAELPQVTHTIRPIVLYYKSVK
jgi:hypothetical protein